MILLSARKSPRIFRTFLKISGRNCKCDKFHSPPHLEISTVCFSSVIFLCLLRVVRCRDNERIRENDVLASDSYCLVWVSLGKLRASIWQTYEKVGFAEYISSLFFVFYFNFQGSGRLRVRTSLILLRFPKGRENPAKIERESTVMLCSL